MTEHQLYHDFARVYRDVCVRKDVELTPRTRAVAASLFAGDGVLAGLSASAMHGRKWIDATAPAEIVRTGHVRTPRGLLTHRHTLLDDEVMRMDGLRTTTPARTAFDIGRRLAFTPASRSTR